MNRRDFTKSIAALGLAPVLPALPAAATAQAGFTPYMYGLGAHLARSNGAVSVPVLMQKLRIAPDAAQAMQAQLVRQGIAIAPNSADFAAAVQPYMRGVSVAGSITTGLEKAARAATRAVTEDTPDTTEDLPEN